MSTRESNALPRYRLQAYDIADPSTSDGLGLTITLCRHNGDHFVFDEGYYPAISNDDYRNMFAHLLTVLQKEGRITLELGE